MKRILYAFALWLFAVLGAVGIAFWLSLSAQHALVLVATVAAIAIFGAFIPALRLGRKS